MASCTSYEITNIGAFDINAEYNHCADGDVIVLLPAGSKIIVCATAPPKPNNSLEIVAGLSCDPCLQCPEGSVLDGDGDCVLTEIVAAEYTGTSYTIEHGDTVTSYSKFGVRLYPDITAMTFPLYGYGTNAAWNVYENDGSGSAVTPLGNVQSKLWGIDSVSNPGCADLPYGGRLNKVGVWANGFPNGQELQFTFCVTITEEKQYLIGIGGDNKVGITINAVQHVFLDATASLHGADTSATTRPFNHWHVFPITLPAGTHTIVLSGWNIDGTRSFGAEIYDISLVDFQATLMNPAGVTPSCGNVDADLEPFIIFSTADYVGLTIADPADEEGVWSCPDGYTLDQCNGAPSCVLVQKSDPTPCCYRLTNCDNPNLVIYTQENLSAFVGRIIKIGGLACYQVSLNESDVCPNPVVNLDITDAYDTCLDCTPYYALKNCADGEVIMYFKAEYVENPPIPLPDFFANRNIISLTLPEDFVWEGCAYLERLVERPESFYNWSDVVSLTESTIVTEQVYKVTQCVNGDFFFTANSDLETIAAENKIFKIEGVEGCFTAEAVDNCCYTLSTIEVAKCFDTCDDCWDTYECVCTKITNTGKGPSTYRYLDCDNELQTLIVGAGQTSIKMCVKLWFTTRNISIEEFGNCVENQCPIPVVNHRAYAPEWTPIPCTPEYIEKTSCAFVDMVYNNMLAKRFKIENCCPVDEVNVKVNYEKLQLEFKTIPGICDTIIELGCLCLTLDDSINPITQISMCSDPTNTFYSSPQEDAFVRYVPQRCRWELLLVVNNEEVLYQTFGSNGQPPIGTWTPLDPPVDAITITSEANSCV